MIPKLNNLQKIITRDGSISLKSEEFNESFHSYKGALQETKIKFIYPSMIGRFKDKSLTVLDVCFGLGYNSALLFNNLINQSTTVTWYGLEIDKRPLNFALKEQGFKELWDPTVINILNSLCLDEIYTDKNFYCELIFGDARHTILNIPEEIKFDLIFLDGFSPQKCPEIWTIEFLTKLRNKIDHEGYLLTYTSSAAVRKTLRNLGLNIFNIKPRFFNNRVWSNGTLASFKSLNSNPHIIKLSEMENEHLETKASIPYRDPRGDLLSKEILDIRKKEQHFSQLSDTNLWRKRWEMA